MTRTLITESHIRGKDNVIMVTTTERYRFHLQNKYSITACQLNDSDRYVFELMILTLPFQTS